MWSALRARYAHRRDPACRGFRSLVWSLTIHGLVERPKGGNVGREGSFLNIGHIYWVHLDILNKVDGFRMK